MAMDLTSHIEVLPSISTKDLHLSLEEYKVSCLDSNQQPFDKVVVGIATFKEGESPAVLVVKRAPHEVYFPGYFELPSGKVNSKDGNILAAICRELFEETALKATHIIGQLPDMQYSTEKTVQDAEGNNKHVVRSAIQLNFAVAVSAGTVKLNAEEHSEFAWVDKQGLAGLHMTELMKETVANALVWASENKHLLQQSLSYL